MHEKKLSYLLKSSIRCYLPCTFNIVGKSKTELTEHSDGTHVRRKVYSAKQTLGLKSCSWCRPLKTTDEITRNLTWRHTWQQVTTMNRENDIGQ